MQDASFVLFVLVPVLFTAVIALCVLSTAVTQAELIAGVQSYGTNCFVTADVVISG